MDFRQIALKSYNLRKWESLGPMEIVLMGKDKNKIKPSFPLMNTFKSFMVSFSMQVWHALYMSYQHFMATYIMIKLYSAPDSKSRSLLEQTDRQTNETGESVMKDAMVYTRCYGARRNNTQPGL